MTGYSTKGYLTGGYPIAPRKCIIYEMFYWKSSHYESLRGRQVVRKKRDGRYEIRRVQEFSINSLNCAFIQENGYSHPPKRIVYPYITHATVAVH